MNFLKRNSTTITIATFWENHQLGKYNYSPSFQREVSIWSPDKQSLLIDTILRNFPMPPIFFHQHIDDETGKTMYDVIDGNQRLTTIVNYIEGRIATPDSVDPELPTEELIQSTFFNDLPQKPIDFKKQFWKYDISIELIDADEINLVNNIFDRLNRNGMPLTEQELRKARFGSSKLYEQLVRFRNEPALKFHFGKIDTKRYEDVEFISEMLFTIKEAKILGSDRPEILDALYEKHAKSGFKKDEIAMLKSILRDIASLKIDYLKHKAGSLSHFHALFLLAYALRMRKIPIASVKQKIVGFYKKYSSNWQENEYTKEYKATVSAGTKGAGRKLRRVNSILGYIELDAILDTSL